MPVITEEEESSNSLALDFSDILDLPEATFAGGNDAFVGTALATDPLNSEYASQSDTHEYGHLR